MAAPSHIPMSFEMAADMNKKFKSKLKQTFRILFIDNHTPCDDTLLEKLYSLLESKLVNDNGDITTHTLNKVPWLDALFGNWKAMDHSVVAFGLNIVGLLSITDETSTTLLDHQESLTTFTASLLHNFHQLNASLRFATLKMVDKLCKSKLRRILLPQDILSLTIQSLTDDSIFVVRAAKDLVIHLLTDSLIQHSKEMPANGSNTSDTYSAEVFQFILKSLKDVDNSPRTKRKVIVILDIMNEVFNGVIPILPQLSYTSQLNSEILKVMLQLDDYAVCSSSCNALLSLNNWSFDCSIQKEWLIILETLLQNNQIVNVEIFLVTTCERLYEKSHKLSPALKSMLLSPIISSTKFREDNEDWKSLWNYDDELKDYILNMKNRFSNCEKSIATKLYCCVLSSLIKIQGCFEITSEKLYILEWLFFLLCDYQESALIHMKTLNSVVDTLNGLLDKWGCEWSKCVCKEDQEKILLNATKILENYVSPTSVMINVMKLFRRVLQVFHPYLTTHWEVITERLIVVLRKRCDDPQWEIRDSAYEMLANITKIMSDHKFVQQQFLKSGLVSLAVGALEDTESYVRASALLFLANIPEVIMENNSNKLDETVRLLDTFIQLLLQDSEGITRRAAVSTLLTWFKKSCIPSERLPIFYKSMVIASTDLDWEVKLITIDFWNWLINSAHLNEYQKSFDDSKLHNILETVGFYAVVKSLACDEDVTVRHKMGQTLQTLKTSLYRVTPPAFHQQSSSAGGSESSSHFENLEINDEMLPSNDDIEMIIDKDKLHNIETVLDTTDISTIQRIMVPMTTTDKCDDLNKLLTQHHRPPESMSTVEFMKWLDSLNIDNLLNSDLITDPYNARPELLLDDILLDNYESEHEQENVRDCY